MAEWKGTWKNKKGQPVVLHLQRDPQNSRNLCLEAPWCRVVSLHWIAPNGCCFCECFHVLFVSLEVFRMDGELWKGGLEVGWALWAGPAPGVHSLVLWSSFVGRLSQSTPSVLHSHHPQASQSFSFTSNIISLKAWRWEVVIFPPTGHSL